MCPDWESKWQPIGSQARAQSTEPHQPGQLTLPFVYRKSCEFYYFCLLKSCFFSSCWMWGKLVKFSLICPFQSNPVILTVPLGNLVSSWIISGTITPSREHLDKWKKYVAMCPCGIGDTVSQGDSKVEFVLRRGWYLLTMPCLVPPGKCLVVQLGVAQDIEEKLHQWKVLFSLSKAKYPKGIWKQTVSPHLFSLR